jgi:hypothetical protein
MTESEYRQSALYHLSVAAHDIIKDWDKVVSLEFAVREQLATWDWDACPHRLMATIDSD